MVSDQLIRSDRSERVATLSGARLEARSIWQTADQDGGRDPSENVVRQPVANARIKPGSGIADYHRILEAEAEHGRLADMALARLELPRLQLPRLVLPLWQQMLRWLLIRDADRPPL